MKLKKFDRNKKQKRIVIASIIGILLIVGGITLYRTFALYEEKLEFNVLKGRIPDFVSGDVQLAMTLDGEAVESVPEGREYRVKTTCEGAEGTWNYSTWSINIGNITSTKVKCSLDFESIYHITINEAEAKEFPTKENEDIYVSMSCTNGTGNWDATNWKPVVTGINENTSCEVKFQTKNNIFSYYLDNNKVENKPSQEYYYNGITTCAKGSAGFDESKWEPIITQYEEGMKCDIKFGTTPITFSNYLIALSETDESIIKQEHEETYQTGANATIDYRYTGANPNNYVCLEASGSCTEGQLYRIIGVIPTQSSENGPYEYRVKLIKATRYKSDYWSGSNGSSSNDWTKSILNTVTLNQTYWNSISSYQKYIDNTKWYLGAYNHQSNEFETVICYGNERGNTGGGDAKSTIATVAKIGLIYPSDYGYATSGGSTTSRNICLVTSLDSWYGSVIPDCRDNDWLYSSLRGKWTITSGYPGLAPAFYIERNGRLFMESANTNHDNTVVDIDVYPTFHLSSSVKYLNGDGSRENPYLIEIG